MEMQASRACCLQVCHGLWGERDNISYIFSSVIPLSFPLIAVLSEVHKQEALLHWYTACFSVWQVSFVLVECNLSVLAKPSGCTQLPLSPPSAGLYEVCTRSQELWLQLLSLPRCSRTSPLSQINNTEGNKKDMSENINIFVFQVF